MHNLLIVDDHQIIIDGLKALFAGKEEAFVIFGRPYLMGQHNSYVCLTSI